MKKIIFIIAFLALTVGCKKEQEGPKEIGSWRSVHQHYSLTLDPPVSEALKEAKEKEIFTDVAAAESYKLAFYEDGTGLGSGVRPDGDGRYDFHFTWKVVKGRLFMSLNEKLNDNSYYIFWAHGMSYPKNVSWAIEEYDADKMVLSAEQLADVDGQLNGALMPWSETHIIRLTFERVK